MDEKNVERTHSRRHKHRDDRYLDVDDDSSPPQSRKHRKSWNRTEDRDPISSFFFRGSNSDSNSGEQQDDDRRKAGRRHRREKSYSRRKMPSPPRTNATVVKSKGDDSGRTSKPRESGRNRGSHFKHIPLPPRSLSPPRSFSPPRFSRESRKQMPSPPRLYPKQMPSPPRIRRNSDDDLIVVSEEPEISSNPLSALAEGSAERSSSLSRKNENAGGLSPSFLRPRSNSARELRPDSRVQVNPPPCFPNEHPIYATGHQLDIPMPFRGNHLREAERFLPTPTSPPSVSENVRPDDSRSESGQWANNRFSTALSGSISRPKSWTSSASGVLGIKTYQYQPLNQAEFRLIKVLQQTMSTIKCEIEHYSLDDPPEYVAVSYAWGDADNTEKIVLEGATIPVTVSLCGALRALREKKKNILVWVDALCIDQQNKDERTQQVLLMTSIYARAKSVAVWLGSGCDDSDMAVKLLEELVENAESPQYISSILSSRDRDIEISAVVSLFERDYWKRLWVVQEVFNARDIIVYCGSSKLPWNVYITASLIFRRHKSDLDHFFPATWRNDERQRVIQSHFTYSQILVYHGPSSLPDVRTLTSLKEESLLEVMRVCREKLSADARDKLYGILGVLPEYIRTEFPVDYNLSTKEVFTNVVDYVLNTTDHLDVICESIHFPVHANSINVPSWVPDWSNITTATAIGRSFKFSASKDSKAKYRLLDGRRKLEISAIFLDEISQHGIGVGTLCTLADYLMAFFHWRALLLGSMDERGADDQQKAFCKTLCLGQIIPGWSEEKWLTACFHVFASLIHDRLPRMPMDRELGSFVDTRSPVEPGDRRHFLQQHFGNRMFGRCFCMTRNGHMGIGSGFLTAGDIVVVPLGCSTPIILRPEGRRGEYYFVGDVYIHDYMEGRAFDELRSGERELRKYMLH